jgi:hypothetical protein
MVESGDLEIQHIPGGQESGDQPPLTAVFIERAKSFSSLSILQDHEEHLHAASDEPRAPEESRRTSVQPATSGRATLRFVNDSWIKLFRRSSPSSKTSGPRVFYKYSRVALAESVHDQPADSITGVGADSR